MPIALALAPAIIGAGASIGTSLINKHGSKNSSLLPPGLDQNSLKGLIGKQTGLADWFGTEGKAALQQGKDTLTQPLDFYQSLLGGDRTKIMESLQPEMAAINAQFRQPLKEATLTGRGSSLVPDLEASKQSAISNLIFSERPAAADKLTQIAQGLMGLGTQQAGLGGGILGQAAGETLDYNQLIRGLQSQHANDTANMLGSLGASLGPILAGILGGGENGSSGPKTPGPPNIVMPDPFSYITSMNPAPEIKSSWLSGTGGK